MSQLIHTLLDGVSANGDGDTVQPVNRSKSIQVVISGTATVKIQVSIDGTNWEDLLTTTSSNGFENSYPWPYMKANVSGYSSGTVSAYMAE